jgi:hypothetical protein
VGGEGLALVVHNDAAGLEAHGCAGTGVGYAQDASHYGVCEDRIHHSLAVQLSPHFNVTEAVRHGRHVDPSERSFLAWGGMDEAGVYAGGDNGRPLISRSFSAPGRVGQLIDGKPHRVVAQYTRGEVRVRFDGEELPTLNAAVDLGALGAFDGSGKAWVGFTASTGITSIDADILDFSHCQWPGCDAA